MAADQGSKSREKYHHGDLGRSLVVAAAAIIAEEGADALTLRGVGQRLGVSRTALYRHFDSKAALLAAVALEGFLLLRRDLEAAIRVAPTPDGDPLIRLAEAYVGFGTKYPPHYCTMFGAPLQDRKQFPALVEAGRAAFAVLVDAIAAGQAAGRLAGADPLQSAQAMWALVHGIVTLDAGGHLFGGFPADHATVPPLAAGPTLTTFSAGLMLGGLGTRPAGRGDDRSDQGMP